MDKPLAFTRLASATMVETAEAFYKTMSQRRTVRHFSSDAVPMAAIEQAILTAGTAPSGANMQPWHFAITTDAQVKQQIRMAAEVEEREFYTRRASAEWLDALAPLGTDADKPFLETAPVLIGVFAKKFSEGDDGGRRKNYYTQESVGIACGLLLAALHNAGLATLTHTPSPMGFLNTAFKRPKTERPFLLLVVGYPTDDCHVPAITKKTYAQISSRVVAPVNNTRQDT